MAKTKGAHHTGLHQRLSAIIRARAYANPQQRCESPTCKHKQHVNGQHVGGLLREHKPGARWQAGHVHDGHIATSLADYRPEVDECNTAAGARIGNQRRQGNDPALNW